MNPEDVKIGMRVRYRMRDYRDLQFHKTLRGTGTVISLVAGCGLYVVRPDLDAHVDWKMRMPVSLLAAPRELQPAPRPRRVEDPPKSGALR